MVELPKPPWYRRFGVVVVAANLVVGAVLVAAVVALWPQPAQRPVVPATTAGVGPHVGGLGAFLTLRDVELDDLPLVK